MPVDPSKLPLLIAGPIVRRVEADLVSVWIATSQPCEVTLLLFDGEDVTGSKTAADDQRAAWVSKKQKTLQIGARLHCLTVQLDLRSTGGNAARSSGPLNPNRPYSYDLQLVVGTAQPLNFQALGLLAGAVPLGFDTGELPSFRTCPEERDQLVIVHGSCRRLFNTQPLADDPTKDGPAVPPGGWPTAAPTPEKPVPDLQRIEFPDDSYPTVPKRDGGIWLDALVDRRTNPDRIAARPHQLFLTGDQIYADDVPHTVLPVLNHLGRLLVGEEELASDAGMQPLSADGGGADAQRYAAATNANFPPGFRREICLQRAGLTTSDGESHLLTFGEFVAYYLLTWSPELWKLDLWPGLADFDPAKLQMPPEWRDNLLWLDPTALPLNAAANKTESYTQLLTALAALGGANGAPLPTAEPEKHAQWYFEQRSRWVASKYWSKELFDWWLQRFREGLPRVRRALANVPTYMLADDHEVSDDWYFSRQWRERVFTRPLGVDLIRHGVMAYTCMQAWGNDPRRWATGTEAELLQSMQTWAKQTPAARRTGSNRLHELLGLPFTPPANTFPTFRPLVEYSYRVEGPCHRVLVIDGRTRRRFPARDAQAGGIDFEGATGLFGDSPMSTALPARPANDDKLVLVVTGVPVLGPEGMELALLPFQRLARLMLSVDAEAWSYDPPTFEALLWALSRYGSVVLLSGDIHMAFSALLDYFAGPTAKPSRIVQLVSSGLTQDWGGKTPVLKANALLHDVLESATTKTSPAERIGWGTPVRTVATPPVALGEVVTVPKDLVAHPSYRARLKLRAPVVPTQGWPVGSTETRAPDWAWSSYLVRDEREEGTAPSLEKRWTDVTLQADMAAADSTFDWHAKAVRRLSYGRVFAFQPNVGVVTFEKTGDAWSVRHVIAGELPPMAGLGVTPSGLKPYIVHRIPLSATATWSARPKLKADGGWATDATDPALHALLYWLPKVWHWSNDLTDKVWPELPIDLDGKGRDAAITKAADLLAGRFRRRILRELGRFSARSSQDLDGTGEPGILELGNAIGKFDLASEARALVRPDLERLMNLDQAIGKAKSNDAKSMQSLSAYFDDALLIACSDWVNERARTVSMIAGLLATFRAPITKRAPILNILLSGLWDIWRNRTAASELSTKLNAGSQLSHLAYAGLGLVTTPLRALFLEPLLRTEVLLNVIEDQSPRSGGGPPVITPEFALTIAGAVLSLLGPKRLTVVSGWEDLAIPAAAGARLGTNVPETLARQTLSLLVHPDKRARYEGTPQKLSFILVPPNDAAAPGALLAAWDGGVTVEGEIGGGVIQRVQTTGTGWVSQRWRPGYEWPSFGAPDVKVVMSFTRPVRWTPGGGIEARFSPTVSLGFTAGTQATPKAGFEFRLALNDTEDRISVLPKTDGFLARLLPTDGLTLPLDAALSWDTQRGWQYLGLGEVLRRGDKERATEAKVVTPTSQASTAALASTTPTVPNNASLSHETSHTTPVNKKLGPLTLHDRSLDVKMLSKAEGTTLQLTVTGTVSLNLGPLRIAVAGLGGKLSYALPSDPLSKPELHDFKVEPAMPTGLALSISAKVVSGGGFLQRIPAADGSVTWRGGLSLEFAKLTISAWGIVQTGGPGHWSLLVFLGVRFSPSIKLAAGWSLVSLGGVVGLHRSMNVDALRDAVTGVNGNLDALFLLDKPEQRFVEVLPVVERFFPAEEGHYVAGLTAILEWGKSGKGSNARAKVALLIELGHGQAALYGVVEVGFPLLTVDHVLRIRAGLEALYDHDAQMVRFSFVLTEALLFRSVRLTGGAALLVRWGNKREFAFTLGGFHPDYRPFIPKGLLEPPRLGAHWNPIDLLKLDLELYLAVTNTSFQFGFNGHLEAGASWGGVRGDLTINCLVMWEPQSYFEADVYVRVTAYLFGCDLISAGLRGTLTGPERWRFEATVYWEVCGVDISKDLGPYEWGDGPSLAAETKQASALLRAELGDRVNWQTRRRGGLRVNLRDGSDAALDPRDQVDVRQNLLPLGTHIEVYDKHKLSDPGVWALEPAAGLTRLEALTDAFPQRRYREKPPKEKPFQAGLECGGRFASVEWTTPVASAAACDENDFDYKLLDTLPDIPPSRPPKTQIQVPLLLGLRSAAPTLAIERKWTRHAFLLEKLR